MVPEEVRNVAATLMLRSKQVKYKEQPADARSKRFEREKQKFALFRTPVKVDFLLTNHGLNIAIWEKILLPTLFPSIESRQVVAKIQLSCFGFE